MYFKGLVGKKFFFCFKLNYCPTQIPTYAAPHLVVVEYLNALPPVSVCLSVSLKCPFFGLPVWKLVGQQAGEGFICLGAPRATCEVQIQYWEL